MFVKLLEALHFYANEDNWRDVETGIGMMPSNAVRDGGRLAQLALSQSINITLEDVTFPKGSAKTSK